MLSNTYPKYFPSSRYNRKAIMVLSLKKEIDHPTLTLGEMKFLPVQNW